MQQFVGRVSAGASVSQPTPRYELNTRNDTIFGEWKDPEYPGAAPEAEELDQLHQDDQLMTLESQPCGFNVVHDSRSIFQVQYETSYEHHEGFLPNWIVKIFQFLPN